MKSFIHLKILNLAKNLIELQSSVNFHFNEINYKIRIIHITIIMNSLSMGTQHEWKDLKLMFEKIWFFFLAKFDGIFAVNWTILRKKKNYSQNAMTYTP